MLSHFVSSPPQPPPPNSYVFPRLLLSHHFWTEQQRHEFWQRDLKHRLQHFYPILDHMALMSQYIADPDMETRIIKIVKKVELNVYYLQYHTDICVIKKWVHWFSLKEMYHSAITS